MICYSSARANVRNDWRIAMTKSLVHLLRANLLVNWCKIDLKELVTIFWLPFQLIGNAIRAAAKVHIILFMMITWQIFFFPVQVQVWLVSLRNDYWTTNLSYYIKKPKYSMHETLIPTVFPAIWISKWNRFSHSNGLGTHDSIPEKQCVYKNVRLGKFNIHIFPWPEAYIKKIYSRQKVKQSDQLENNEIS